ncbi:MAG: hypothetical protein AVDCRST_MAG68-2090 [uncultured Gemmatimonadetes bacterium]|uniref:Uncharacterized protein n=1 Tax=uncultured Gemmatimonadota bacterium TaxID=203437 RepID=A0A6J4L7A1_9BACT|nr:MAG: hypothetical protein AVDCRST_MAG68-2090 [uncultured Gemmatimonadota bacterium]
MSAEAGKSEPGDFDVRLFTRERMIKLADKLIWDAYNEIVDDAPGMDSDEAFTEFEELFGSELVSACLLLVKPSRREEHNAAT